MLVNTITQEYLWTLERNLDCMPEVTVAAGARSAYSSSMCSIPTASQHCTLEVPLRCCLDLNQSCKQLIGDNH